MSDSLPKFNFSNATIKTEEELQTSQSANTNKFFLPGRHAVTISAAEYAGKASDPNWGKVKMTLSGMGEKKILNTLLIPEKDVNYVTKAGKTTTFLFTKFKKFMSALGVDVKLDTLGDTMAQYYTNVTKSLVGKTLTVEIGYVGNHVAYLGKKEDGSKRYSITMKDGSMLATNAGDVLEFKDVDSAKAHCEAHQITIQDFPEVTDYDVAAGAKGLKSVSNW